MSMLIDLVSRDWWVLVLRGIAGVLFGFIAITWPDITLGVLIVLFGAYAIVDGALSLGAAVNTQGDDRWWHILSGASGIVAGLIAWIWPGISALALLYLIASWALVVGGAEVVAAITRHKEAKHEWMLGISGVIWIIFGIVLVALPGDGAIAIITTIGIFAIFIGAMFITSGLALLTVRGSRGYRASAGIRA